jgi:phosphatidylglycerol lysyltransferase
MAAYLGVLGWRRGTMTAWGKTLSLPSLPLGLAQVGVSAADWILAAAVPYVLLPGSGVSFPYFLGVFLLAQMAGVLSAVPGGLGVVETVAVFLLADRMDSTTVVGTLLVYRILYYLGPLVIASGILGGVELAGRHKWLQAPGRILRAVSATFVPYVISVMVFLAGLILMISGSLGADPGRLGTLRKLVPLPAIEMSHFIGSVLGSGLLILSYGLQRRLRLSYYLVLAFLACGIVALLVKGLHVEEALILLLFLGLMIPCRNHFYRRASLLTQPFSGTWALWMLVALTCTIWITLFSYRHVPYSSQLWWQFAFDAGAPRSMRAATASVVILLSYALLRLLLPAHPRRSPQPDESERAKVRRLVETCPRSSANLALLPDKRFVWSEDGDAFIMYAVEGRSWIAMGDPIGAEEAWPDAIWRFRDLCDRYSGWPVFYQIGRDTLGYYTDLGLGFHKLGEEARVELAKFSLEGNQGRDFRNTRNKYGRQGFRLEIVAADQVLPLIEELEPISQRWLSIKHVREKRFSLGFFDPAYLSQTPLAVVRDDRQIIAFSNLWLAGGREECSVDLMRYDPESGHGVMDFLFVELMLWGREQGYRWFNLGMAPLSGLEQRPQAPLWQRVGGQIYRHAEHFYNFQGLYRYKAKFNPQWTPRYLACPRGWQLPTILANLIALISGGVSGAVRK